MWLWNEFQQRPGAGVEITLSFSAWILEGEHAHLEGDAADKGVFVELPSASAGEDDSEPVEEGSAGPAGEDVLEVDVSFSVRDGWQPIKGELPP